MTITPNFVILKTWKKIPNIHDAFSKDIFSKKENIRDFFKIALPKDLQEVIDLDNLETDNVSLVPDTLKEYFSDLIIHMEIHSDHTKKLCDIYILFEHKSYKDKKVYFQLFKYMSAMWEHDIREGDSPRNGLSFLSRPDVFG